MMRLKWAGLDNQPKNLTQTPLILKWSELNYLKSRCKFVGGYRVNLRTLSSKSQFQVPKLQVYPNAQLENPKFTNEVSSLLTTKFKFSEITSIKSRKIK